MSPSLTNSFSFCLIGFITIIVHYFVYVAFSLPIEKFTFSIGLTCSVVVVASVVGSVGASVVSSTVSDSDAEVSETDGSSDFSLQPVNDTPVVSINADTTAAIIKRLLFLFVFHFLILS